MAQPVFSLSRHTRHDLFQAILHSLNALPEVERKVFVLSHYENAAPDAIAQRLKMPLAKVSQLLRDANIRFFKGVRDFRLG